MPSGRRGMCTPLHTQGNATKGLPSAPERLSATRPARAVRPEATPRPTTRRRTHLELLCEAVGAPRVASVLCTAHQRVACALAGVARQVCGAAEVTSRHSHTYALQQDPRPTMRKERQAGGRNSRKNSRLVSARRARGRMVSTLRQPAAAWRHTRARTGRGVCGKSAAAWPTVP